MGLGNRQFMLGRGGAPVSSAWRLDRSAYIKLLGVSLISALTEDDREAGHDW